MYGIVDVVGVNISATGEKSQAIVEGGGLSTSRLGVKGAEDLGGGLKAVYNYEIKVDPTINTGFEAARQGLVGLAGNFGTVAAGYLQTTAWDFGGKFDPTGGSAVSALQNVQNSVGGVFLIQDVAGLARAPHAIAYISPTVEGFKAAVNFSSAASTAAASASASASATAGTNLAVKNTAADVNSA